MNIPEMTLRDYFAAQIIGHLVFDELEGARQNDYPASSGEELARVNAANAYRIADAMLEARKYGKRSAK